MTELGTACVHAVVVTYQPEPSVLSDLLASVLPQVAGLVLVDNGDAVWRQQLETQAYSAVSILPLGVNRGLAMAQNEGIAFARSRGASHILLLDQDSIPSADMVPQLMRALVARSAEIRVAAVGPRFEDAFGGGKAPFVRLGFPLNEKLWCPTDQASMACDFLISSGSLIPVQVFDAVGLMDSGLFIDNVDLEWSFRARAKGYQLYGVCGARMRHRLGDARRRLPFGSGELVVHGPVRLYYMMRNRLILYGRRHTPAIWIAQDVPRLLFKLAAFSLLVAPRGRNLRFMLRGIMDGLRGRLGPCPLR